MFQLISDSIKTTPNEVYGLATDGIETTPNEVYGLTVDGIKTTPNEVYGLAIKPTWCMTPWTINFTETHCIVKINSYSILLAALYNNNIV